MSGLEIAIANLAGSDCITTAPFLTYTALIFTSFYNCLVRFVLLLCISIITGSLLLGNACSAVFLRPFLCYNCFYTVCRFCVGMRQVSFFDTFSLLPCIMN